MKKRFYFVMLLCLFVLPLNGFSYMPDGGLNPTPGWEKPQFELPGGTLPQYTPPKYTWAMPDFGVPTIPNIPFDPSSSYIKSTIVDNGENNFNVKLSNSHIIWNASGSSFGTDLYVRDLYDASRLNKKYKSALFLGTSIFNDAIVYAQYDTTNHQGALIKGDIYDNSTLSTLLTSSGMLLFPSYSYGYLPYIKIDNGTSSIYMHYDTITKNLIKPTIPKPPIMQFDKKIADGVEVQQIINYKNKIVWYKRDNSSDDYEIMYYDGDNISQITNNSFNDMNPFIHKNIVAWQSYDGHDFEIMYWNGSTITQITNNDVDDIEPTVYNGTIAWSQKVGSDYEIMYYDGTTTHQITSDNDNNTLPYLFNGAIAWIRKNSSAGTSAVVYSKVDTPWIPAPAGHNAFSSYSASFSPVVKTLAKYCKPVGVGDVANNKLYLKVRTPKFEEAVDIYFALKVPEYSSEYYLFKAGGGIQPLSQGVVAWKTNVTNAINETIYNGTLTGFPKGHYNFYFIAVPKDSGLLVSPTPPYYFWQTGFELN